MPKKKRLAKKGSTSTAEARQSAVQGLLRDLGGSVYTDLDSGRFPSLTLASRSVRNIVYDKKLQQFVLGATTVRKSSGNIKHIRPFTQLVWLAYFAKKLVDEKRTSTLRDVFYSAQAFNVEFQDQAESDELITDLEVLMSMAREGMNIYPEERSAIFGDMTIEYTVPGYEGKRADLSANPDGVMIGPALTTAEFRDTDAEIVLAIEKGGLFTRFTEERVHKKYKAILINTAGQPPRSTRYLIRRLNQELGLPVGILCDADPWGAHIAMVIRSGSVRRDEPIMIRKGPGEVGVVQIGEFVDECIGRYGFFTDSFGNEVCSAIPCEVLTADSNSRIRFKPLSSVIRHRFRGRLYTLTTSSGRKVTVTPNHSVFILRNGEIISERTDRIRIGDLLVISRNIPIGTRQPMAIDVVRELTNLPDEVVASNLRLIRTDTVSKFHRSRRLNLLSTSSKKPHLCPSYDAFIETSRSKKGRPVRCPARLWLTKPLARLLGYYTAEGWINMRGRTPANVSLCFGLHELEVIEDALACIAMTFPGVHVSKYYAYDKNSVTLSFGGVPIASLFYKLCGSSHGEKRVPDIIYGARSEHVLEYLKGCFGDGYVTNSAGLCWKFKNPGLIHQLGLVMNRLGVLPSFGKTENLLMVTGKHDTQRVASTVLHEDDRAFVLAQMNATNHSSYLMPKAFPALAGGLMELRAIIGRHQYHDLRCRYTFQRLCEIRRGGVEGAIDREHVGAVVNHLLNCSSIDLGDHKEGVSKLQQLVSSDLAFDPITEIGTSDETDEYVYDISVPGVERFIGGKSGILLHNSANAAHLRELTTPESVWLGVYASDIQKYKLPSDKLTEIDIKRLYELKADPRYTEKMWHDELETFLKFKRKSEQEAFARYGLSYIVDKYLPDKLQLMKSA
jgi:DNA topoisomerase-6 subunit A